MVRGLDEIVNMCETVIQYGEEYWPWCIGGLIILILLVLKKWIGI